MYDEVIERGFAVEMRSEEQVKSTLCPRATARGSFSREYSASSRSSGLRDEAVFTVRGAHGTMRIDINEKELRQFASKDKADTEES